MVKDLNVGSITIVIHAFIMMLNSIVITICLSSTGIMFNTMRVRIVNTIILGDGQGLEPDLRDEQGSRQTYFTPELTSVIIGWNTPLTIPMKVRWKDPNPFEHAAANVSIQWTTLLEVHSKRPPGIRSDLRGVDLYSYIYIYMYICICCIYMICAYIYIYTLHKK